MKGKQILVSIIVPIYNSESNLTECINSLVNQSLSDIEIILINDGSTDSCRSIMEKFRKIDNRIITVNKINEGVSAARNLGIGIAKGKYIGFIDSDDYIDERMYEKLYYKAVKEKSDVAMCRFVTFSKKGSCDEIWNFEYESTKPSKMIIQNMIGVESEFEFNKMEPLMGSVCRCIYNKEIIDKYGICFNNKITFAEDLLFNINYLIYVDKVALVDETLYLYRESENSLSRGYRKDLFIMIQKLTYEIKKIIRDKNYEVDNRRLDFSNFKYAIELIRNEAKTIKLTNDDRYKNIKVILEYKEFRDALKNINIKKLNYKNKFFFIMIKYKVTVLKILLLITRKVKIFARRIIYG